MKSTIEKLPKSEVKINFSVEAADFAKYYDKGVKEIQQVVDVDGFRKGHVPADQIIKKYGEMIILEEMANICLRDLYPKLLDEHKIFPIAEPTISITKLAKDNPFEASVTIATFPEVTLPDYKKLATDVKVDADADVTDKELDDVLMELRKGRATGTLEHDHEHDENGHHPSHDAPASEDVDESKLPVLDDAFAQSFGGEFKNLEELKSKIKENLALEKKQKASDKRRSAIVEKLLTEVKADVNDVLIESELDRMMGQMKADIARFGGTWDEYLAHAKKTEADLRTDWRKDAERRALTQLILHSISEKEKIAPTEAEIEVELVRLMAMVKDADETRARAYLHQALTNEKVLKFLEEAK
jgi:trigger factor